MKKFRKDAAVIKTEVVNGVTWNTVEDTEESILQDIMIEVELTTPFKNLKEVLTRFGIANRETKTLTQSVHVLKKGGKFYLCHFKMMYMLDGKNDTMSEKDYDRFYMIALLMEKYKLVKIVNDWQRHEALTHNCLRKDIFSIPRAYLKDGWVLKQKYTFGNKRK